MTYFANFFVCVFSKKTLFTKTVSRMDLAFHWQCANSSDLKQWTSFTSHCFRRSGIWAYLSPGSHEVAVHLWQWSSEVLTKAASKITLPISNKQERSQPPLEGTSGGQSNRGGSSADLWEAQLEAFLASLCLKRPCFYLLLGVPHLRASYFESQPKVICGTYAHSQFIDTECKTSKMLPLSSVSII